MEDDQVTGFELAAYRNCLHALVVEKAQPWPGGHMPYYRACLDFVERNGYQTRRIVDDLMSRLSPAFVDKWSGFPEMDTRKRIELGLDPGMSLEEIEQEVRDMDELAPYRKRPHRDRPELGGEDE